MPMLMKLDGDQMAVLGNLTLVLVAGVFCVFSIVRACLTKRIGWIISATLSGLASLFLLLALSVMIFTVSERKEKEAAALAEKSAINSLKSIDGTMVLRLPRGWKEQPRGPDNAILVAASEDSNRVITVFSRSKQDYAGNLEEMQQTNVDEIRGTIKGPESTTLSHEDIAGHPARLSRITGEYNQLNIIYFLANLETEDRYYQLIAWTIPSRLEGAEEEFREIFYSFRLTGIEAEKASQ